MNTAPDSVKIKLDVLPQHHTITLRQRNTHLVCQFLPLIPSLNIHNTVSLKGGTRIGNSSCNRRTKGSNSALSQRTLYVDRLIAALLSHFWSVCRSLEYCCGCVMCSVSKPLGQRWGCFAYLIKNSYSSNLYLCARENMVVCVKVPRPVVYRTLCYDSS